MNTRVIDGHEEVFINDGDTVYINVPAADGTYRKVSIVCSALVSVFEDQQSGKSLMVMGENSAAVQEGEVARVYVQRPVYH